MRTAIARLSHFEWYHGDSWVSPADHLALGRIGIGVFNTEPQPLHSADGQRVLVMCGELFHTHELLGILRGKGITPRDNSHPELALAAYEAFGADFAAHLNGDFSIAIFDRSAHTLLLTNDRFGMYPVYYAHQPGKLAFAPEVKGVLAAPFVERKLNLTAVAEYTRFQHMLGTKTFHEGIELLPGGSVAQFDFNTGGWSLRRYWTWGMIGAHPETSFEEASLELGHLLRQAVEERSSDNHKMGVFLSGGLDSRTLLGLIPPQTSAPVSATFGAAGSRDVYYAERIARTVGSQHHWFPLTNGDWILNNVNLHLKLTEGFHSWIHMHGITMLPKLRGLMDVNLSGWDGGTIMGHGQQINPPLTNPVDDAALMVELYRNLCFLFTWPGLTEAEERLLYTPTYKSQMVGRAFESLTTEFAPYNQYRLENRAEYFYLDNHCIRMTLNMNTIARSHLEVRFPFWDYDLMDTMYGLPTSIRANQILYRHIITRETPALSRIPYDKEEFLPSVNPFLYQSHRITTRIRRRLKLFPERPTLYADYE
ncbi:MAG: asparagine synthase, partial [Anaerolineae bacterium]|nr:asparagine synthase [Anaerolineae bacterium]